MPSMTCARCSANLDSLPLEANCPTCGERGRHIPVAAMVAAVQAALRGLTPAEQDAAMLEAMQLTSAEERSVSARLGGIVIDTSAETSTRTSDSVGSVVIAASSVRLVRERVIRIMPTARGITENVLANLIVTALQGHGAPPARDPHAGPPCAPPAITYVGTAPAVPAPPAGAAAGAQDSAPASAEIERPVLVEGDLDGPDEPADGK